MSKKLGLKYAIKCNMDLNETGVLGELNSNWFMHYNIQRLNIDKNISIKFIFNEFWTKN